MLIKKYGNVIIDSDKIVASGFHLQWQEGDDLTAQEFIVEWAVRRLYETNVRVMNTIHDKETTVEFNID